MAVQNDTRDDKDFWIKDFTLGRFDGFCRSVAFILTLYLSINDIYSLFVNLYNFNTHN